MTLGDRLKERRKALGLTQQELAKRAGVSQSLIAGIERGHYVASKYLVPVAEALETDATWLSSGEGSPSGVTEPPVRYRTVHSEEDAPVEIGRIPYWDARGSCGGGFLNYDQMPVGHLVKEASFFKRYNIRPENAIAVYADGDSMSNFIVDGDIVIFDTSKTEPQSNKIFLIDHPDGLRIKQLRREIDGTWVLSSLNPDKQKFPDERVPGDQAARLKIHGQFVYRQGG
jgi:phage repressor protein C with HTH and peptisase S24 domain